MSSGGKYVGISMGRKQLADVLIVDDDVSLRQLLRMMLQEDGYAVQEAGDGQKALEILRAAPVRMVVLLDLWMPRLGGDGVLQAVEASNDHLAQHAYILVTANTFAITPTIAGRLERLSVPVIAKPFDADDLMFAVRQAADRLVQARVSAGNPPADVARE
jgi:DNA-binding NtrC family response regulator